MRKYLLLLFTVLLSYSLYGQYSFTASLIATPSGSNGIELKLDNINMDGLVNKCSGQVGGYTGPHVSNDVALVYEVYRDNVLYDKIFVTSFGYFQASNSSSGYTLNNGLGEAYLRLNEYNEDVTVGGSTAWYTIFKDRLKTKSKFIYTNPEICNGNSYIADYKFVAKYFSGTIGTDFFGMNWYWCPGASAIGESIINKPKIAINVTNENAVICKGQNITFQAGTINGDQVAFYKDAQATIPYGATNQLMLNPNTYTVGLNEFWVKVTNQGCASIIKKIQFTVNESPTDLVISGAQNSYCTGNPLLITPSANGANISYQWSSTSNFANILDASFVDGQGRLSFIPSTTGNFTYYVRAKNVNGCSTDPKEVSFNVINGITNLQITNNGNAFCNTQPITFTAGANGATNYQWFKDNLGAVSLGSGNSVTLGTANWTYGTNTIYVRATNLACQTDLVPVTFTVNQVPTNIQVTGNVGNYCIGNPVLVTPSAIGGTGITYEWSLASNFATLLDASFVDAQGRLSYTPNVAGTVTYYVRAKSASGNCNSSVETVTFTVSNQVSNVNVTPTNPVVCFGSAVTFTASATNATSYKWTKDSQGVNIIGNQSALTLSAGDYVLGANTIYLTVTNAGGCNVTPMPIAFTVNQSPSNLEVTGAQSTYCTGNPILITPSATGTGLTYEWSANSNFTTLLDASFVDSQGRLNFTAANTGSSTYYVRAFNGNCYSSTKTVTFTINTGVSNLQVSNNNGVFCKGDTVSFTVGATNATNYTWYKFNNATGVLQTGPTYTPQATDYSLGVPTTMYVQASNGNGCSTALMPVTYTVNPSPENLQITGNSGNYCVSSPILITPSATMQGSNANITYEWSLTSNFASLLDINFVDAQGRLSYTPNSTGSLTYFVRAKSNNGCYSPSATVTFTVNSSIGTLTITNQNAVVCNGQNVTFTAGATGATSYSWYQDAAGTISLGNNQNLTLQPTQYSLGVNKIYVQAKGAGGCNSAIIPVNFTVNQSPTNLVITGNSSSYCVGSQIMVSPSAVGGGLTYEWSSNINFTTLLNSSFVDGQGNLNYIPVNTGTYTYYVRAFNGSCYSNVVTYTFNVVAGVGTLQVSNNGGSFCQGQTFNFTAGATGATTFNWYKFSNATGILSNGATYTPQTTDYTLDVQQTVYVQASNGSGCQTALLPVTFTVYTKPYDLQTSGNQNTYCLGTPVLIQPTASVGTGNLTFEWSSTSNFANLLGSSFVDASGNLNYTPAGSGTVTYYVRAKGSGGCVSATETVTFTVSNQVSNITVTPSNPVVCFGASVSFSASATNATSYTWSTDSQGVNVIGSNSSITLSSTQYTLGVNTIYLKVGNAGGCNGGSTPVSFTVNEAPTNLEVTGNANTYCTGSQVQISPSATGSNVIYEWSLNTNFTTLLDASYVNAQGILSFIPTTTGTYTYYVRAKNASGCATVPKTVTFVVNQGVGTIQVSNNGGSFCQGQTFGFTAGAVNATTYSWFKFSNGTGLLSTGSTFNPTAAQYSLGANTIYVQASSGNNCSTALLPVTFTVNAVPTNLETTGNAGTYCIGNAVMISPTATGGSSTTFEWSITSNFANILGSSFVDASGNLSYTPSSAGTFTYYVRAKGLGGCYSDTKTVTFAVSNQVSNITVTPLNPLVCFGSPVTFTASATNATTYKWTSDALGVNIIGNNSTITVQSTNYILGVNKIYLTVGNAGGCNVTPIPVSFTVNEAPSNLQITGQQTSYCSGSQILVTPSATGSGLTFQWSANSNFATLLDATYVDAQGRLNYVPSNTGAVTYYVRATNGSGCYSNTETLTFTVNQGVNNLQVTNNGNSYCQGQTISFTAGAVNATNYYWYKFSNATGLLSTGSTFNPTATQYSLGANTVYVQASSGNNCSTALLPVTFTVNAVPTNLETTGNAGNYCIGNPVLVTPTAIGSTGLIYEWSSTSNFANLLGSSFVDANGNLNYTPAGSGTFTYYVRAKGLGGCYSDSKTVTFIVSNQVSNVTVSPSNPTICFGSAVTFTASATNATSYKWTKDIQGVNIIGTQSTLTLSAADYVLGSNKVYLTVTNAGGCNATPTAVNFTVNEAPSNLEVNGNAGTYCTGGQVTISPSATGTGLTYEWSANSNFTNLLGAGMILPDGTLSFSPSTIGTVTYYVRAVNANGCATAPKTVTFNVNQGVGTLQVTNNGNSYCQGQTISFTAGAINATSYSWFKFSNGTGLLSTGATFNPTAAQYTLGSNTIYVQASSGNNCSTALLPVTFTVNAVPANLETTGNAGTYCIGNAVLISPTATGGSNTTFEWSITSNFANLLGSSFVDANGNLSYTPGSSGTYTYYVRAKGQGNCYSDSKTVTFIVSNQVSNVTVSPSNPTICFGSAVTFTASATNATSYKWTKDIQGVNILGTQSTLTLSATDYVLGGNTIYLTVTNAGGCNVTPMPIAFTVNQSPSNLEVNGNAGTYCTGGQVNISPSATGTGLTYEWSANSNFTNLLGAGMILPDGTLSFSPSTIGTVTYYVRAVNANGCATPPKTVTFNVNQGVGTLQVSNNNGVFCQGVTFGFTAGAVNATTYSWYKFSNATGLLSTGATFNPTAAQYTLGSNTIYVQASSGNNCSTALLPVTFTVNAVPTNLEATGNAGTYCIGTPILIQPSATGGANNTYEWSITSNFVNLLGASFVDASGNLSYTPSSAGTFTYYVRAKGLGGCYSDTKTVTLTVSNQVSNVTITPSNPSVCFGSPVSFTASASNATSYTWSTDNQGANIIGNSASITLQSTSYTVGTNTIYLKVGNAGGCNVTPIPVTFTVNPTPTNLVVTGNAGNYCVGNPIHITPSATGTGLIYEWSTSSTFVNILGTSSVDANGSLHFNASTTGTSTYYVRAKGQGGCVSATETVAFVVNSNVGTLNITNQNAVVCNGQNVSFTASATGATSYSWYQDAAGLVSIGNNQNITILPADYALGTNTIYVQAKGAGGCNSAIVPVNFTVNTTPTNLVLAGNQSSYCSGSQILVTPTAVGTGLIYQWSSSSNFTTLLGSSFVDNDGRLNYVPSNIGTFTYYVRGTNGSGCYSNVESITFNVTQGVSNLQISNNNGSFCQGQTFSFTAGATGATTFNWYKFPNGTGLLFSGATYTPQAIDYTIGSNTIYVQAVAGNSTCSTAINPVNFTVNESPTAIAYTGETNYCLGQQVYIEPSALGNNLSYQWSTTANFASGNILGSSFVDAQGNLSYTPTTTGTKIYYVRAFNGSCYSSGIPVTIVVNTQPTNLAVSKLTNIGQTTYCQNGSIEKYLATGVNITSYKWYTDIALTQEVLAAYTSGSNNNTLNVDPSIWTVGTHNIFIVGENTNGCKTQAQSINFTIIAGVSAITPSINNFSMCQSETKVVNMDNPNNFTINWYTNSAGTVALSNSFISNNGNTLTLPAASFSTGQTTLYYKVQNAGGCMSTLMPVSFTVLLSPSNLTVTNNNASACLGQNLVFEASAQNTSEFLWYKNYATGLVAEPQYLTGTNNYKLTIPTGNFSAGTYTYTVVAKNSSGCLTAPIDVTFTVQSVPGNSTLTGIVDYCKSETVHFELVNSSSVTFKWYNDINGLNPVNASYLSNNGGTVNIPASTFTTGSHTLYYYATNGNCNSTTQSVTFTVKDTPSNLNTSGNNGTYCYGSLIDIVVGSQGGATNYEWFEDSAASLALNTIYITGANHERLQTSSYPVGVHTVYVRGVNSNGCKSALLPISFTVNSAPVISTFATANATVQTGTPINFGVTGTGYTKWKLLFNGSQVAPSGGGWNNGTITNFVYNTSAILSNAGTYTLVISNGTCETQQNFTLYVIPQITITHDKLSNIGVDAGVNKVILNQHDKIIFSSSIGTTPNYTEEWTYGDGFSNTTTSGEHVYNNAGEFTVKLKVVNTQNGDVFNVTYELPILVKPEDSVVPTDTLNPPDTNYTVYPNPYKEFLGLKYTGQAGDKFVLRIYDIRGISLFNTDWVADGVNWDKRWYSPLLTAPQGTYIVVVHNVTKGTKWNAKLLKQ